MSVPANAPTAKLASSPLHISVVPNSDFVIQLALAVEALANATKRAPRLVRFGVSRTVLQEHSAFFQTMLSGRPNLPEVNFTFENKGSGFGYALEVWLRAIHNGAHTIPNNLKATRMEQAWVAIGVGEQFGFAPNHIDKIKPWFLECYSYALDNGGLNPFTACCLAFPCHIFDHPAGFMKLTKYLVYNNKGNNFTQNPSSFHQLHQDARILDGPLTAARAHVQSILDKELSLPIDKLHNATCACRKETAFDYEDALRALDCWPVDRAVQKYPIAEIIDELEKFEFTPKTIKCESGVCSQDYKHSVNITIRKVKFAFEGLCLDCMERSQVELVEGETRQAFIKKNSPFKGFWDINCRFGHGRVSWYYSWMGPLSVRRDILDKHHKEQMTFGSSKGNRRNQWRPRAPRAMVPPVGVPAVGVPAVGVPAVGVPAVGVPAVGVPAVGVPAGGVPAGGVPAGVPAGVTTTGFSDIMCKKKNDSHDVEDNDVFFDAEDASLEGCTLTNDTDEAGH